MCATVTYCFVSQWDCFTLFLYAWLTLSVHLLNERCLF